MSFKKVILFCFVTVLFFGNCLSLPGIYVTTSQEIDQALVNLQAGDRVVIGEGRYLFDHTLVVQDKEGIEIVADGDVWLLCEDPYMDVLTIKNSTNIYLEGLRLRHLKPLEEYSCHGSVLSVKESSQISIKNCELNGCGAIGLDTSDVHNLVLRDSRIHQNSFTAFYFNNSSNFDIQGNVIENNGSFLEQYDCENIILEDNTSKNNSSYW